MTASAQDTFAASDSAFTYAIRPLGLKPPKHRPVPSPPPSPPSPPSPPITLLPYSPPPMSNNHSTTYAHPTSPPCSTTSSQFVTSTNTLTLLHYSHIRTLLMRCQILHATIRSFAYTSRTHEAIVKELRCRDEFQHVAREARRQAEGAKDKGLQARAAEWVERAELEMEGGDWGRARDARDTGEGSRTYEHFTKSSWCEDEEGDSWKETLDDDSSQYLSSEEGFDREESLVYEEEEVRGSDWPAEETREEKQQESWEPEMERNIFYRIRI